MADTSGDTSRVLFAIAATLFIAHNVLFVMFTMRQFNEETLLKQQYEDQLERIRILKARCPKLRMKENLWVHLTRDSDGHHLDKRQTDAAFQQMITEQELILKKHCSNGTGFCVQGPKGDTGPKGVTGLMGDTGPVGIQGPRENNGTHGVQGLRGDKGVHGDAGAQGARGPQGPPGLKGEKGLPGEQGVEGTKGLPGVSGTKGPKGANGLPGLTGVIGLKGDPGIAGVKGDNGTQGPPGQRGSPGVAGSTPYVNSNCTCAVTPFIIGPKHENIATAIGSGFTLNCSVGGSPSPKIVWTKTGTRIPANVIQQGTLLTIPDAHATDSGDYKCHADNGLGSVDKTFNVKFVFLSCDFERDFCSWTQSQTDNNTGKNDWTYYTGGTPTSNTGPSGDHTQEQIVPSRGHYVYLESSIGKENDKAELLSPTIGSGKITCLQFWYHMWGIDINSLKVFLEFVNGSRSEVWSKTGDQGNKWQHAVITIPAHTVPYKIVIQSNRGKSIQGDIGLDDILVNNGDCPMRAEDLNCNFESSLCYWIQSTSDKMDLIRHNGATVTTSTGPTTDHTLKSTSGHYLYLESSNGVKGDTATVTSPLIKTNSDICFSVWYHMYGSGMGTVKIYVQKVGWVKALTWTRSGPQGNEWREARFTVPRSTKSFHIIIETEKGKNPYSDIAIDDITAKPQPCSDPANSLNCDFENGFCNWTQGTKDNFDWKRQSGPPAGGMIGPSNDHTLQTFSGHYIYIDPSLPETQKADLQSPVLSANTIYCLDFWYFLDGTQPGSIFVRRTQFNVNVETLKEIKVSPSTGWHELKLGVASFWSTFNLAIEGVRGHDTNSYIAVDDIKLSTGVCKT